jgi:spore coat-associated protein N
MSKRLLISLVIIAMSVAVVGAGTFAYYSDTETSANNTFTAGTLDLEVKSGGSWFNGTTVPSINAEFDAMVNNLKPGDAGAITIPVKNSGSLPGTPSLKFYNLAETAGVNPEPEGSPDTADLAGKIDVVVKYDGTNVGSGTLASLAGTVLTAPAGSLGSGAEKAWTVELSIDGASVGNEIMGDTATVDVEFGLVQ